MKLAIVGATGLVGKEILKVIQERRFFYSELILVASKKSKGKEIIVNNKKHIVITIDELIEQNPEIVLLSAGSSLSKEWAPKLAEIGCKVVDNSSFWRMCSKHKLIIPEINGNQINNTDLIIANPNCSTIQMLVALKPLSISMRKVVSSPLTSTRSPSRTTHSLTLRSV